MPRSNESSGQVQRGAVAQDPRGCKPATAPHQTTGGDTAGRKPCWGVMAPAVPPWRGRPPPSPAFFSPAISKPLRGIRNTPPIFCEVAWGLRLRSTPSRLPNNHFNFMAVVWNRVGLRRSQGRGNLTPRELHAILDAAADNLPGDTSEPAAVAIRRCRLAQLLARRFPRPAPQLKDARHPIGFVHECVSPEETSCRCRVKSGSDLFARRGLGNNSALRFHNNAPIFREWRGC